MGIFRRGVPPKEWPSLLADLADGQKRRHKAADRISRAEFHRLSALAMKFLPGEWSRQERWDEAQGVADVQIARFVAGVFQKVENPEKAGGYLFRMVRNAAVTETRRARREFSGVDIEIIEFPDPDAMAEADILRRASAFEILSARVGFGITETDLSAAIESLDERQLEYLYLRHVCDFTHKVIAKRLNFKSESTARNYYAGIIKGLRGLLPGRNHL